MWKTWLVIVLAVVLTTWSAGSVRFRGHNVGSTHTTEEKQQLADRLKALRAHTETLVEYLQRTYPTDPRTTRMTRWFRTFEHFHETEHHENHRSFGYNVNKGQYIAVCLHDARNRLNPFNETFFVLLHELAHVATEAYAHNAEFYDAYRWLIRGASDAGLYRNVDYSEHPVPYCHHRLDHNPAFFSVL